MRRCRLDKIASVTARLALPRNAVLGDEVPAVEGTVVAGRILNAKTAYSTLEDVHGRQVGLHPGDVIAGALGHRDALHGYSGRVPERVRVGDVLDLLNLGGVIGAGAENTPGIGPPFRLEVLGAVLRFPHLERRVGVPANVADAALSSAPLPPSLPPILTLVGTSMDSGKTTAACVLIAQLARRGLRIAAGKLTGVSLRRDVLQMQDSGAERVSIFTDYGVVTTSEANAVRAAHSAIAHLAQGEPDLIVLEMGDGLLGTYGVQALLGDAAFRAAIRGIVLCAQDPVGAWGAVRLLEDCYGLSAAAVSGHVTDTPVGRRFCREQLALPAWNALRHGEELAQAVLPHVAPVLAAGSARA